MDASTAPWIDLALTLRQEQDRSYRADLRLRHPASASDCDLAVACPVTLDPIALAALSLDPVAYGRTLAAQLFADAPLRAAWEQAATVAAVTPLPMRLRLDLDPRVEELHALIWETLMAPGDGPTLALSERVLLSRYLGTRELASLTTDADATPRAIIAVANPSDLGTFGMAPIDVAGEITQMQAAFGAIPSTILATGVHGRATLVQISAALRDGATVLYLACHGSLVDDEPYLWLETDDGRADRVGGTALVAAIQNLATCPRLIILGSCRSGGDGVRVLPALAPRLVSAGVPAVIGAQGDLPMALVAQALPILVTELRRDGQIDRALAVARASLRGQPDWWRLALWMHLRDGQLWPAPPIAPPMAPMPLVDDSGAAIRTSHLRLSFIWAETLDEPPRKRTAVPLLDLGSEQDYTATFDPILAQGDRVLADGTRIAPPWPKPRGQNFWYTYLEQRPFKAMTGKAAYKMLVPLRVQLPLPITTTGFAGDTELEGFCYPHGVACVITVRCTDELGVAESMLLAAMVRHARLFTVQQPDGAADYTLDELADLALGQLTAVRTGNARQRGRGTALEPFSVATVVRGSGVPVALPFLAESTAHHLLEALTRWQIPAEGATLSELAQARIPTGTADAQAGDLLYGHTRGRAVWLPRRFASQQPSASLGCYHRNLVFAALQIESLGGLIRQADAQITEGRSLSGPVRTWAQRAYGALSRLHSGGKDVTYRTMSSQRHLSDNEILPALNRVRIAFGREPLADESLGQP